MRHFCGFLLCSLLAVTLATTASGQTPSTSDQASPQTPKPADQPPNLGLIDGTIDSIGSQTMVVKTDDNQYQLFVFDSGLVRPNGLTKGTRVKVASRSSDEPGLRIATGIGVRVRPVHFRRFISIDARAERVDADLSEEAYLFSSAYLRRGQWFGEKRCGIG